VSGGVLAKRILDVHPFSERISGVPLAQADEIAIRVEKSDCSKNLRLEKDGV
jgi:hypothetical protein